jgi:hypothetical protein
MTRWRSGRVHDDLEAPGEVSVIWFWNELEHEDVPTK